MARLPRSFVPNIPVHLIQRGNNRSPCFLHTRDYEIYLEKLKEYSEQFQVAIHSYVLMTNHVHLLATPELPTSVSQMMQSLGAYYVRHFNRQYQRSGTLWEGRYKSCLIDTDRYFLTVSRYIELNPVRANMCTHPSQYPWSSFQHLAGGAPNDLIRPHSAYRALGTTEALQQAHYTALFNEEIPEPTIKNIRDAYNKAWVLGGDQFKRQIEQHLGHALPPCRVGRRRSELLKKCVPDPN